MVDCWLQRAYKIVFMVAEGIKDSTYVCTGHARLYLCGTHGSATDRPGLTDMAFWKSHMVESEGR